MSTSSFSKIVPTLEFTGERFIPGSGDVKIHMDHLQRYVAVAALIDDRSKVIDYGCGVGYGAHFLAQKARQVLAVDIAEDTIRAARQSYHHERLDFQTVSSAEIPVPDRSVDLITCFEVIEHTNDQAELIGEFERVLKPDGLCVISTPERRTYSERTGGNNPFHVAELTFEEFDELLARLFPVRLYYRQRFAAMSMFLGRGFKNAAPATESILQFQRHGDTITWSGPKVEDASALYYVAICTKTLLPDTAFRLDQILVDENDTYFSELAEAREAAEARVASLEQEVESARSVREEVKKYDTLLIESRQTILDLKNKLDNVLPLVSIVIICWNNRRFLKRCFDSLMQTDYPNLEIFLADNASADGSAAFVAEHYPSVRVIVNPTNLGFAEGNNRALRLARGKYVITLNPDTEVDPNWIRAMVDVAESDGSVGMISPKMYILDRGRLLNSAGGDMLLRSGDNLARGFYLEDDGRFDKVEETFGPSAGAGFYRRAMLDDIGLFDKGLFTYYEDVDLNMRAQLRGYRCLYVPEAKVYHYQSGTLDDNNSLKLFFLQRNKWYVVLKDFPLGLIWHCRRDLARSYVGAMLHLRKTGHKHVVSRVHLSLIKRLPRILVSRCAVSLRRESGSARRIGQWMDRHEDTYQALGQAAAVGRYYEDIRKRGHENPAS